MFQELESVVNKIYAIAEWLAPFAIPALSEDAVDAILNGEEVYSEDSLLVPEGFVSSTSCSVSEQNKAFIDLQVNAIKRIIIRISTSIDSSEELIPIDHYWLLVDRIDRGNGFVRYASYAINQELSKQEISREHHLRFETLRTSYQSLLKELNVCVSKYNIRHRHAPLSPEFSTDVSPINGVF